AGDSREAPRKKPRWRWFRFGLKSLLLLILVLSLPLGWLAAERHQKSIERAAVAAIHELGGGVWYDSHESRDPFDTADDLQPPGPAWLRFLLGDDFFVHATEVNLSCNTRLTDGDLSHLGQLPGLKKVYLHETAVSDDGLRHLQHLRNLKLLYLVETQVT